MNVGRQGSDRNEEVRWIFDRFAHFKHLRDGSTDRPTDRRKETTFYRCAKTHLEGYDNNEKTIAHKMINYQF